MFYHFISFLSNNFFLFPDLYMFLLFILFLIVLVYNTTNYTYIFSNFVVNFFLIVNIIYIYMLYKYFLITFDIDITLNSYYFTQSSLLLFIKIFVSFCSIIFTFMFVSYFYDSTKCRSVIIFPFKEFFILFYILLFGIILSIMSNNLFLMYLGMELISLCLYIFPILRKKSNLSAEASSKYFIYSVYTTAVSSFGLSFLYGVLGTLNFSEIQLLLYSENFNNFSILIPFAFISISFSFKMAIFPFHSRISDIYVGAPLIIVAFFAIISKIPSIIIFVKLFVIFYPIFQYLVPFMQVLFVISIVYGSLMAIVQINLRRLLAFSAMSHLGLILLSITQCTPSGIAAALNYMVIYVVLNIALSSISIHYRFLSNNLVCELESTADIARLYKTNPILGIAFATFLFSMAGIPPFAGFFAKLFVFISLIDNSNYFILFIIIFVNLLTSIYYIRLIKNLFFNKSIKLYADFVIGERIVLFYIIFSIFFINIFFIFIQGTFFSFLTILVCSLF